MTPMRGWRWCPSGVLLATLGFAFVTAALPAARVSAQTVADAGSSRGPGRDALDRGIALLLQRRWVEALPHLEESTLLEPSPLGWFNLGLAYRGAGRIAAAVSAFERYIASPEPDAPPARLTALRAELPNLSRSIARLRVHVTPAGATIRVDGRPATMSGSEIRVDPGTHAIEFHLAGHESASREVNPTAGALVVLEIQLRPMVQAPTPVITAVPAVGPVIQPSSPSAVVRVGPDARQASGRRGWVLPVALLGGAAVAAAVILGVVVATSGTAPPMNGSWDTVREP